MSEQITRDKILQDMLDANFDAAKYGEISYNAFMVAKGYKNVNGKPLQKYSSMKPEFQEAWSAFAYAISNGKMPSEAWDEYYKVVSKQLTYAGQPHEWTFTKVSIEEPSTARAIEAAANAAKNQSAASG